MADKKKPADKKPADDAAAPADQPAEEPKAEEPAAEAPAPAAPADDSAAPGGTDQYGRQLFNVKCANCGKDAQVPFKPSGDRPVYCRDCYSQQRGGGR